MVCTALQIDSQAQGPGDRSPPQPPLPITRLLIVSGALRADELGSQGMVFSRSTNPFMCYNPAFPEGTAVHSTSVIVGLRLSAELHVLGGYCGAEMLAS